MQNSGSGSGNLQTSSELFFQTGERLPCLVHHCQPLDDGLKAATGRETQIHGIWYCCTPCFYNSVLFSPPSLVLACPWSMLMATLTCSFISQVDPTRWHAPTARTCWFPCWLSVLWLVPRLCMFNHQAFIQQCELLLSMHGRCVERTCAGPCLRQSMGITLHAVAFNCSTRSCSSVHQFANGFMPTLAGEYMDRGGDGSQRLRWRLDGPRRVVGANCGVANHSLNGGPNLKHFPAAFVVAGKVRRLNNPWSCCTP